MSATIHNEIFAGAHFNRAYAFGAVPALCSDAVSGIWLSRFEQLPAAESVDERLFAQLSASVVLHEGSPFFIENTTGLHQVTEAVVIGPQSGPLLFHHLPDNRLSGIKLRPGGFYRLLGIPAQLVHDKIVPLKELLRTVPRTTDTASLLPALHNSACPGDPRKYAYVQQALQYYHRHILDNPGLEELARHLHLGTKTLHRYFLETLGCGPRKACSVLRIREALTGYRKDGFSIYHYGYTDNSHFYKDLQTYTSLRSLKRA